MGQIGKCLVGKRLAYCSEQRARRLDTSDRIDSKIITDSIHECEAMFGLTAGHAIKEGDSLKSQHVNDALVR